MPIQLKCYASLDTFQPRDGGAFSILPGETLGALEARLGIPEGEVTLRFVNGRAVGAEAELKDGDRVGLFPPVGGG